jgi:hypothetical protein
VRLKRTLFQLWLVGTSLWVVACSVVIYDAYQEPYDLWLIVDPEDDRYHQCWPKPAPAADSSVAVRSAHIQRVATCYRGLNRMRQTITRFDVLKQGIVTIGAVPVLVLEAGLLFLSFTGYPRRPE